MLSCINILLKLLPIQKGIAEGLLSFFSSLGIIITFVLIYKLAEKHDEVMGDNRSIKEKIWNFIKKISSFILVLMGKIESLLNHLFCLNEIDKKKIEMSAKFFVENALHIFRKFSFSVLIEEIKSLLNHLFCLNEIDKKKGEMSAKFFVENDIQSYIDKIFSFILVLTSVRIRDIGKNNHLFIVLFIFICLIYFIENRLVRKISAKEYHISSKDYWKVARAITFFTFCLIPYSILLFCLIFHFKVLENPSYIVGFGKIFIFIYICLLLMYKLESKATKEPKVQPESAVTERVQSPVELKNQANYKK